MAISYNLSSSNDATPGSDPARLEVSKPLILNGASVGKVRLRVGSGTQLWIARADLDRAAEASHNALPQLGALTKDAPYVSFAKLRASGLTVRYDPAGDRIEISG